MNEFNFRPPLHLQNPVKETLQDMERLQTGLVEALGDLFAEQSAMRSVLGALIATHPEPKLLAEAYLQHMDATADATPPERIEIYREAAQRWRDMLLERANQRQSP